MLARCLVLLLVPAIVTAQAPHEQTLRPATGTLKATFGNIPGVRELEDGRVLVPNGLHVALGYFETGESHDIPDAPSGRLVRLAGDSTIIVSNSAGWVFLDRERILGALPPDNLNVAALRQVLGADNAGFVLGYFGDSRDSGTVLRVARVSGSREVVARVWQGLIDVQGVPAPVYQVVEQATMAPDGWIAVLRAHPYRMDWRDPDGTWTLGAAIDAPAIKVDDREKAAYMAQQAWPGRPPESPSTIADWPKVVEPFTTGALMVDLSGEALVRRTRTADHPDTRYDVIDRHGTVLRQVVLPADQRIVGFGSHSVYVGVQTGSRSQLVRHPWP
jgi:hypothetical protein